MAPAGFAGGNSQRHELTTSGLVRALGEHVGQAMQVVVQRPSSSATALRLQVIPEEAQPI